ncbi:DUF6517 family protein [Halorientalis salina]|uniref:DUF6517 family protein n=1 Tax=Halorientalis salina TaxID=2932266 RepID=UPI0010ABFAFD|nr:DUF6517 family protein [Halorientalis salina]
MDRRIVAVGGLIVLLSLSGCIGFITGEPLEFESSPAAVSNSSAAETGFTLQQYNGTQLNQSIDVAGVEREVRISFHQAVYTQQLPAELTDGEINESTLSESQLNETSPSDDSLNESLKPAAVTIVSLPDAQFFGESVNPLVRLPNEQLIERFGGNSQGSLENLEKDGERSVELLGSETTVTEFNATAESENGSTPMRVSVTKTAHEGDVVIVVAIDPNGSGDDTESVDEFIAEIEHPTEAPN